MKQIKIVDLSKLTKYKSSLLGLFLAMSGLVAPLYLLVPLKGAGIPRESATLVILAVTGVILSKILHPYYHRMVVLLITASRLGKTKKDGRHIVPVFFRKWEAVFIKVAPLTDLTLMGILGLLFLPGIFLPTLLTFVSTNLWYSGADVTQAFYIAKHTGSSQLVSWTANGFAVWEE